jgi:hypothetical protein
MPGRSIDQAKRREDLKSEATLVGERDARTMLADNLRQVVPVGGSLGYRLSHTEDTHGPFFRTDDRTGVRLYMSKSEFGFLAPIFEREKEVHRAASGVLASFNYDRKKEGAILWAEYVGESAQSSEGMQRATDKVLTDILSAFRARIPRDLTVKPPITIRIHVEN